MKINIEVELKSWSIDYDDFDKMYSATITYATGGGLTKEYLSDKKWGSFENAKKWVEEIIGEEIE